MKKRIIVTCGIASALFAFSAPASAVLIDLEDLRLEPGYSYENKRAFTSQGASFSNLYNSRYEFWEGFAYSELGDTQTPGYSNQYSSFAGGGAGGDGIFAVGFVGYAVQPVITLPEGFDTPLSIGVTNTTYTALSMRDGDSFAKKFGGFSGNDPDYFRLTISGLDAGGLSLGSVEFMLADFQFANNAQDYILDEWAQVDLSSLGSGVRQLKFSLSSSDVGQFGMNTPAYFAIDNVQVVPEPGAGLLAILGMAGFAIVRSRRR